MRFIGAKMHGWLYDLMLKPFETAKLGDLRQELLKHARGRVLELGAGTGLNFPHYPEQAEVQATEPDQSMLRRAAKRADRFQHIKTSQADAQALPFVDASFDTLVATLVFCSIQDPDLAFREAFRVLRPGGRFLLLEHVKSPRTGLARFQNAVTPIWKHLAGNCHLNREHDSTIRSVGFAIDHEITLWSGLGKIWILSKPLRT